MIIAWDLTDLSHKICVPTPSLVNISSKYACSTRPSTIGTLCKPDLMVSSCAFNLGNHTT
ncbi:hypothetical protein AO368_1790 [Moraxella catarrhalis]|nr:hypothetical protein AO378_1648 [Moraxella catarrhalis]OAV27301.1 hypothetical protein AO368_1790 [Moraxella catarrhalis]